MKKFFFEFHAACIGAMLCLGSCTEEVMNTVAEAPDSPQTASLLRLYTRGEGDITTPGWLYLFKNGSCVTRLEMNGDGEVAALPLSPGSYAIYAIGGGDLSNYVIPEPENAQATSAIIPKEGSVMGDLLMGATSIELDEGEAENASLELKRKVFRLDQVVVKKVPDEVTKVELAISPVSEHVQLDGTYSAKTGPLVVTLVKGDGGIWSATPAVYAFPSSSAPTMALCFTTSAGVEIYRKTMEDAILANTKLNVEGTYAEEQPSTFSATITAQAWPATANSLTFDFDETNNSTLATAPVVGQMHDGYYVVSVNETARTAVLLAKTHISYNAPGEKAADAPESDWLASFAVPMTALEKPFAAVGEWRVPTVAECSVFTADPAQVNMKEGVSSAYFCLHPEDGLRWGRHNETKEGGFESGNGYNSTTYLRPVIEVAY